MNYGEIFKSGRTFNEFMESVVNNAELWRALSARTHAPAGAADRIATVSAPWRLLVIADDWCGDAVNILPVLAHLADTANNLELRIVGRDDYPELMDAHLTAGSRSIPVVLLLDSDGQKRGWWGPRPRLLQDWFVRAGRELPKEERYLELRRWYARDRGVSIANEIADLIWRGERAA